MHVQHPSVARGLLEEAQVLSERDRETVNREDVVQLSSKQVVDSFHRSNGRSGTLVCWRLQFCLVGDGGWEDSPPKGTAEPLAFPQADVERVEQQADGALAQLEAQLRDLERFAEENSALSKLVKQLPESVSHQVMVPFGKAAFFPGRLVHTNEFLVLLGERYYAERSAKQTVQFLARRGEFLGHKRDALTAQIADIQAEVSFARDAAEEAAQGLMEIREPYEEPGEERVFEEYEGAGEVDKEDERRMFDRLEEMERAEAAAGELEEDDDESEEGSEEEDEEEGEEEEDEDEDDGWIREREVGLGLGLGRGRPSPGVAPAAPKGILASGGSQKVPTRERRVRFSDALVEHNVVERPGMGASSTMTLEEVQDYRKRSVEQPLSVAFPRQMQVVAPTPAAPVVDSRDDRSGAGAPPPARRFAPNTPSPEARRAFTGSVVERQPDSPAVPAIEEHVEAPKRPVSRFRKQMEGT